MKKLILLIILLAGITCQGQSVHFGTRQTEDGWRFTVSWCIINLVECDLSWTDEFGRVHYNTTLVDCREARYDCGHKKDFVQRDTAFNFYKRALKEVADTSKFAWMFESDGFLLNVRIDSLWAVVKDSISWDPPLIPIK
jgi:hypothetical protein